MGFKKIKTRELKKYEFYYVSLILILILIISVLQTIQLASLKNVLAKEGLSVFSNSAPSASTGSTIPEEIGGCFR